MIRRRHSPTTVGLDGPIGPTRRPWAFTKGVIAGAVLVIPVISAGVWLLSQLGFTDPDLRILKSIRTTAVFAGAAAILTAGGVGRIAAQAALDDKASRRRPVVVAARAFAVAGAGLTIIATIPHGHLPDHWSGWLGIATLGALAGAVCGAGIGAICGGAGQLGLIDVMALARWPSEALRNLLEPEDLEAAARSGRRRRRITFPFLFPAQARADARAGKPAAKAGRADPTPAVATPAPAADPERGDPGKQ